MEREKKVGEEKEEKYLKSLGYLLLHSCTVHANGVQLSTLRLCSISAVNVT